jgi:acyl-CoA synthetase (AMP-forming)/AMP-acid ligase II
VVDDAPQPTNLGAALYRGDRRDETALIDLGGRRPPKTYTFRDIDAAADAVACGIAARGYPAGSRIAIIANNRMEFMAVFLGAIRAGLVAVPLNFKQPAATIDYMLHDCDAKLVFFDAERAPLVPAAFDRIGFDDDGPSGFAAFLRPGNFTAAAPVARDAAMFLYTSGSSGVPKGVVLSHASHLWVLAMRKRLVTSIERVLIAAPLYHMNGLGTFHASLYTGNSVVLMPGFKVPAYIDAIERYRVTWITAVPPMIAMLLQRPDLLRSTDLSSVHLLRMGSAPVSQSLLDATRAVFPKAVVSNVYGTTEAGPIGFGPHPKGLSKPPLSVGAPVADVAMRLVDNGDNAADEGVLHIKSPALMTGYHNKPDATRKAISDDGYFISGDVFRRDHDGFYFFVGRADDMFVSGGENIYPGEVEKMLEQLDGVRQVCVVPVDDAIKGTKPVAFIVPRDGVVLKEQQVKDYALKHAAPYLHPRRVWFLKEMPLAGTNKIDRKALMRLATERIVAWDDRSQEGRM